MKYLGKMIVVSTSFYNFAFTVIVSLNFEEPKCKTIFTHQKYIERVSKNQTKKLRR